MLRPVEIKSDGMVVGVQNVNLLSFDTSFVVTAFTNGIKTYGDHLMKFLKHASLKRIQWVNFNKQEVVLKTIE